MGDRNCAFEGCNALEFRTSGYCLRHKGDSPGERNPVISGTDVIDSESAQDNPLLIPKIVLGYVVLTIFVGATSDGVDGWLFIFSSVMCGFFVLLPLYIIYLVLLGWQRFKDGNEVTWNESKFHIIAIIVLIGFCALMMMLLGMGSPA